MCVCTSAFCGMCDLGEVFMDSICFVWVRCLFLPYALNWCIVALGALILYERICHILSYTNAVWRQWRSFHILLSRITANLLWMASCLRFGSSLDIWWFLLAMTPFVSHTSLFQQCTVLLSCVFINRNCWLGHCWSHWLTSPSSSLLVAISILTHTKTIH